MVLVKCVLLDAPDDVIEVTISEEEWEVRPVEAIASNEPRLPMPAVADERFAVFSPLVWKIIEVVL